MAQRVPVRRITHYGECVAPAEQPREKRPPEQLALRHVVHVEAGDVYPHEHPIDGPDVVADDERGAAAWHMLEPLDVEPPPQHDCGDDSHRTAHDDIDHRGVKPRSAHSWSASATISSMPCFPVSMTRASGAGRSGP